MMPISGDDAPIPDAEFLVRVGHARAPELCALRCVLKHASSVFRGPIAPAVTLYSRRAALKPAQ